MLSKEKKYFVFFNGDADGICSVLQFILNNFCIDSYFTGPKRDQALLRYANDFNNADLLVFDVELSKNQDYLKALLDNQCRVTWFDHHGKGEQAHFIHCTNFTSYIDTSFEVNTSLIVNKYLNDPRSMEWVIAGLFGDNLNSQALNYCKLLNLSTDRITLLNDIGKLINYNSYGNDINNLIIHPLTILNTAKIYIDPVIFYHETDIIKQLKKKFEEDFNLALSNYCGKNIVFLPNTAWALRSCGILSNYLINLTKNQPIAVLLDIGNDYYQVSVRAPLSNPQGAGNLCSQFVTGGGRETAGGINRLCRTELEKFIQAFEKYWNTE